MAVITIDRRTFIIGASAFFATNAIADSHITVPDDLLSWLREEITDQPGLRSPEVTGPVPDADARRLAEFGVFIARQWGMDGEFSDLTTDLTSYLIFFKAAESPSYLNEYEEMAAVLRELEARVASREQAFEIMAFWKMSPEASNLTRVGRFRQLVFREFAYYIVSQGGFKRFKPMKNYFGYRGGRFTQADLPYRGLD